MEDRAKVDEAIASAAPVILVEEARQLHVVGAAEGESSVGAEPPANAAAAPAYYWEAASDAPLPPVSERVAQTIEWLFARVINAAEVVGEVFTDILGLTNPRYEWAVEAERNRVAEFEEAERIREQRERWQLIQRMNSQAGRAHAPSTAGGGVADPATGSGGATAPVLTDDVALAEEGGTQPAVAVAAAAAVGVDAGLPLAPERAPPS